MKGLTSPKVVVVGGGPAGSIAAEKLARSGLETFLIERDRKHVKTCGGALTLPVVRDFDIPRWVVERKVEKIRLVSPSGLAVEVPSAVQPIFLVCRERLDEHLRERAQLAGAHIVEGVCTGVEREKPDGLLRVIVRRGADVSSFKADVVIGADGARSVVARSLGWSRAVGAVAYQERVAVAEAILSTFLDRVEAHLSSEVSPDFYGWVFPKGNHLCVGAVAWRGRKQLKAMVQRLKEKVGVTNAPVSRHEGGFLPLGARKNLVRGRVLLVGDAAGLVSPLSGEGIFYAMKSGEMAAQCVLHALARRDFPQGLRSYDQQCLNFFRRLTRGLRLAQRLFYKDDARREAFVRLCGRRAVQEKFFMPFLGKTDSPRMALAAARIILTHLLGVF